MAKAEWSHLYKTAAWRRLRLQQLALHPLCQWCLESDVVTEATEVHHAIAHKGDLDLFWSGPFVSTCKPCHSHRGQLEDHGKTVIVFGPDGFPL
jgi:5-methylcytosine-specific restriction protein A